MPLLPRVAASDRAEAGDRLPHLTGLADGVFAYTEPNRGGTPYSAGVVAGPDGVTVIDAAVPEARARMLAGAVEALDAGPVRTVVATHDCGGHPFGSAAFPGAAVIAHTLARAGRDTGAALPSVTFDDRLTVHCGERRIELLYCGPAHTAHDVAAWLPGDRLLFAGGVVSHGTAPSAVLGSVEGMLRAVGTLRGLGARTVVCGHGRVCGPEAFDETEAYLRWIQSVALKGWSQDLTPLQAARAADPGDFGRLAAGPERIVGNLRRAYAELDGEVLGEPLDARR
ncbi:MBL fold metallo-hydrolase [Streptomyces sp. MUM 178J]|uniref:MBL fold metallo-hydrolase n=1 Tax=Streptomyces sp. MUM 178J TaxID=2791991 RepID=UPI001F038F7B|nr:MBL fold metallo-hydrolase [Streptomyces sp. MUM 178J]WRQ82480.1 MBL fold metallo-hydrolase [Streptomyces sp. MUM 178J]